jgi:hypothetical protein
MNRDEEVASLASSNDDRVTFYNNVGWLPKGDLTQVKSDVMIVSNSGVLDDLGSNINAILFDTLTDSGVLVLSLDEGLNSKNNQAMGQLQKVGFKSIHLYEEVRHDVVHFVG